MIRLDILSEILPYASMSNLLKYYDYLEEFAEKYEVNTPMRIAHFLSQVGHESGSFKYVEEIASGSAYEGRKDLGNTRPGDGVKYKGRGLIQITGRSNYEQMSKMLGVDFINGPTLLQTPRYAVESAFAWWRKNGLNELADKGDVKAVTKRVNGGYNGLDDRIKIFERAKRALF